MQARACRCRSVQGRAERSRAACGVAVPRGGSSSGACGDRYLTQHQAAQARRGAAHAGGQRRPGPGAAGRRRRGGGGARGGGGRRRGLLRGWRAAVGSKGGVDAGHTGCWLRLGGGERFVCGGTGGRQSRHERPTGQPTGRARSSHKSSCVVGEPPCAMNDGWAASRAAPRLESRLGRRPRPPPQDRLAAQLCSGRCLGSSCLHLAGRGACLPLGSAWRGRAVKAVLWAGCTAGTAAWASQDRFTLLSHWEALEGQCVAGWRWEG